MSLGSFEIFLKLSGIPGETTDKAHKDEIEVLSFDGAINHVAPPLGGGGAAGKASFAGVRFRKHLDKASVPLLLACAAGSSIADARFAFRRTGSYKFDFYVVTLETVFVTRIEQRAGVGGQYPLSFESLDTGDQGMGFVDEVTLAYEKIHWEYQIMGPKGSIVGTVQGGWDLVLNKKI
jgi:type VI secretion system secreted protein Hcp